MLRILGSPKRFCDGITRRDSLVVGGLSVLGLTLADVLRANATASTSPSTSTSHGPRFGQAKSCILLFLYGSPSQLEMFDMKPNAPMEVRGELKPIRSSLPGCDVCELLPQTAKVMKDVSVVRSLTHKHPSHGVAFATSALPEVLDQIELNPHDGRHWPFIGSVVDHLEKRKGRRNPGVGRTKSVPDNIALPWPFSSRRKGEVPRAGPYAAWLGAAHNPHFTEFLGSANRKITKTLQKDTIEFDEPYVGIEQDCRFTLGEATTLPTEMTLDRLDRRKSLLQQFEDARRDHGRRVESMDSLQASAFAMIGNEKIRTALDVQAEPAATRDSYGHTVFGQSCLAARRLVESGSRFVTVFWDEFGLAGSGWDTHWEHYPRMKNELMPGFDRGYSGLISDLVERGRLDDTLVVVLSEHGRTPKLNSSKGGGRDHWSQAYSAVFAGSGVARGKVVGKTDAIGGTIHDRPVSPKDVLATIYHLLGYDLETILTDKVGRPQPLIPGGTVLTDILA